ncbi:MAG: hypothetical protein U0441_20670 [Polyangiaceae bacterium]
MRVCEKPVLGGVSRALDVARVAEIVDLWGGQTDLFLLLVDRDGPENAGRREALTSIENQLSSRLKEGQALLGEHAIEEVEVWILAGLELPSEWSFRDIRRHPHPKEAYFIPYLTEHRRLREDAVGRGIVAEEAARSVDRICALCPEDFRRLRERLQALL